jgi:threonine/homoserine/homoserine lactone efflux protein
VPDVLVQLIGDLLPAAVGVALSPVPVVAVVLVLGTAAARRNGPAFALGWIVGLVAVSTIVLLVAGGADDPDSGASDTVNVVELLFGLLLLALAVKSWRGRPEPGTDAALPGWMSAVDGFTPMRSFAIGAALSGLNPKNLALTMAASATIAEYGVSAGGDIVAVATFVILGSLTVVGPVVAFLALGERVAPALDRAKAFMAANNAVIMAVVCLVLAAKLIGDALGGLAG